MKGVILSANPSARLVDLGHRIPPQDVRHAAFFLAECLPCFPPAARRLTDAPLVRRLAEPRFWRHPVSPTFHGRDILAPVAAFLSLGGDPAELGGPVTQWVPHELPAASLGPDRLAGEVLFADP